MQKLRFECPNCNASGSVKFGKAVKQFDYVELTGDFKLDTKLPNNVMHCKCGCALIILRAEQETWRVINATDHAELRLFAERLRALHRQLESEGQMNDDWALARSLEDRIGSLQQVRVQDICQADNLLAQYSL